MFTHVSEHQVCVCARMSHLHIIEASRIRVRRVSVNRACNFNIRRGSTAFLQWFTRIGDLTGSCKRSTLCKRDACPHVCIKRNCCCVCDFEQEYTRGWWWQKWSRKCQNSDRRNSVMESLTKFIMYSLFNFPVQADRNELPGNSCAMILFIFTSE